MTTAADRRPIGFEREEKGSRDGNGFIEEDPFSGTRKSHRRHRAHPVRVAGGMRQDVCEAIRRTRPRNHRICDLSGRACGHCDYCDHCLQAQVRRAVERDRRWDEQLIADESGQSTVEYAIVFTALLAVLAGACALMGVVGDGLFVQHAVMSASHCLTSAATGIIDALCY